VAGKSTRETANFAVSSFCPPIAQPFALYNLDGFSMRLFPRIASAAFSLLLAAAACLSQTSPTDPSQAQQQDLATHLQKAQEYLRQKQPALAIPEFEAAVAIDPSNADTQGNLGVLLFFRNKFSDAVPHLRAAVTAKPDLWKIQGLLGLAEAQVRDVSASRGDLEAAFPHVTEPGFQLEVGRALVDEDTAAGDLDKAADTVSVLLAAHPTDPSLLYLSYRLYSDLAGRSMLTLALSAPESAEMHQVMARELAHHHDDDAAIANYREAIRLNPQLPGVHSELGDILFNSQDEKLQAQAAAEFEAALAVNPRDEKAELSLGMIAARKGDLKTALADDSRAVELDPGDTDACTELAKVLILTDQPAKAQQMFERAVQIDPTNYAAHYRLASLYREQGKTDEAKEQVAEFLKYKQMKDKLGKIFDDMRVSSGQHPDADDAAAAPQSQ
jgi:Tfp pilus assembly protein PilF